MSYIPTNVGYSAQRLSEYSRNRFKLIPTSADTLNPSGQLNIPLPEGSICDLQSLRLFFKVTASGATGGGETVYARLPADSASFFNRMAVTVNGVQINGSSSEWNSYCRLSKICRTSMDKDQSVDRALQHGAISGAKANEVATMCLNDFPGTIFGSSSTRFVHTGMLGSMILTATLAGNDVLVPYSDSNNSFTLTAGELGISSGISYKLSEIYATIDCINLGRAYDELLMGMLAQQPMTINYKEIYSFTNEGITSGSSTSRFSLATRSLDKVFGTFRNADHLSVGKPAHTFVDSIGDSLVGNKFRFRLFDSASSPAVEHQFSINNTPYPQYRAKTLLEGLADTFYSVEEEDMGEKGRGNLVNSLVDYNDGRGVVCLRLDHPTGVKPETRVTSGLSTLGVNMAATWDVTGQTGIAPASPASALVICEVNSQIVADVGKMISVNY